MLKDKVKISRFRTETLPVAAALIVALSLMVAGCGDGGSSGTGITGGNTVTTGDAGEITSFEECAARGYPVMTSYPARCVANGKEFVEAIDDPDKVKPPAMSTSAAGFEELSPTLRLTNPRTNEIVQSPLLVEGEAGGWYFEGEFPVKLLNSGGSVIAQGSAIAQGDWMTTDFVPFKVTLIFTSPANATGTLVFEASNPRGNGSSQTAQISVKFGP